MVQIVRKKNLDWSRSGYFDQPVICLAHVKALPLTTMYANRLHGTKHHRRVRSEEEWMGSMIDISRAAL